MAAITIQLAWRCTMARKIASALRYKRYEEVAKILEEEQSSAAILLQRRIRAKFAHTSLSKHRSYERATHQRILMDESQRYIARAWKHMKSRRQNPHHTLQININQSAAIVLQCFWRKYMAKRKYNFMRGQRSSHGRYNQN
eukprot:NODE_8763_length_648_cov_30.841905_g8138_i0.p1 GENE.NODE_8763_length_648_cov_30.841905_g8138_i0~~NODE_8763_length_648_cov_30.841905_g8138_i0.p1  ORF type:complete len:153 (-),score=26.23 NODE_8763_length_648_cov_30.841905_g8138_i0:190-612(-)